MPHARITAVASGRAAARGAAAVAALQATLQRHGKNAALLCELQQRRSLRQGEHLNVQAADCHQHVVPLSLKVSHAQRDVERHRHGRDAIPGLELQRERAGRRERRRPPSPCLGVRLALDHTQLPPGEKLVVHNGYEVVVLEGLDDEGRAEAGGGSRAGASRCHRSARYRRRRQLVLMLQGCPLAALGVAQHEVACISM